MSTEDQNSDAIGESEQAKPVGASAEATPASRFREQVESRQANLDDFEAEDELWHGGFSPKAMFGTWITTGIVSLALLIAAVAMPQFGIMIALGIVLLLWIVVGLIYGYRRLGFHYQLTTQRFIHQTGILTRKTDRIEVIDIDDVSYSQGPVQRVFGVGTITLTGSDRTHPTLSMVGIAKVKEVAGLIDDIRRKERRKRSLHIEAI